MEKFLTSLFDFGFSKFITPTLIKFLYIVSVVLVGIAALMMILTGFIKGVLFGIIALIIAPVVFIVEIALIRLGLETLICIYRTANYTAELARSQRVGSKTDGSDEEHDSQDSPDAINTALVDRRE